MDQKIYVVLTPSLHSLPLPSGLGKDNSKIDGCIHERSGEKIIINARKKDKKNNCVKKKENKKEVYLPKKSPARAKKVI